MTTIRLAAVKLAMTKLSHRRRALSPLATSSARISYAKNHAQTPEKLRAAAIDKDARNVANIYAEYERLLHQSKALDFDDLLLRTAKLLREVARRPRKVAEPASSTFTSTNIRTPTASSTS